MLSLYDNYLVTVFTHCLPTLLHQHGCAERAPVKGKPWTERSSYCLGRDRGWMNCEWTTLELSQYHSKDWIVAHIWYTKAIPQETLKCVNWGTLNTKEIQIFTWTIYRFSFALLEMGIETMYSLNCTLVLALWSPFGQHWTHYLLFAIEKVLSSIVRLFWPRRIVMQCFMTNILIGLHVGIK